MNTDSRTVSLVVVLNTLDVSKVRLSQKDYCAEIITIEKSRIPFIRTRLFRRIGVLSNYLFLLSYGSLFLPVSNGVAGVAPRYFQSRLRSMHNRLAVNIEFTGNSEASVAAFLIVTDPPAIGYVLEGQGQGLLVRGNNSLWAFDCKRVAGIGQALPATLKHTLHVGAGTHRSLVLCTHKGLGKGLERQGRKNTSYEVFLAFFSPFKPNELIFLSNIDPLA